MKLNVQVQIREHECVSEVSIKCKKRNVLVKNATTYYYLFNLAIFMSQWLCINDFLYKVCWIFCFSIL